MYLNERSDSPSIFRAESEVSILFKAKKGHFDIYDKAKKESREVSQVEIIPINDSRFTIRAAENIEGEFIFSGLYKTTRQKITVLQKKSNKTSVHKEGYWEKGIGLGDPNLKFVKLLFCLYKDGDAWRRAEFELRGIAAVQWNKIAEKGTDRIMLLSVSPEKTFDTGGRKFFEMTGGAEDDIDPTGDSAAKAFALDIKKMFDSYDQSYEFYEGKEEKAEELPPTKPISEVVVPVIQLNDEEEEDIKIEDVPFQVLSQMTAE